MKKLVSSTVMAALVLGAGFHGTKADAVEVMSTPTGVIAYDQAGAYNGYTLFAPSLHKSTYLLDMEGDIVHEWKHEYNPGLYVEMLPNGNLLRGGRLDRIVPFSGGCGILQEIDWDGKVVWEQKIYTDKRVSHHAFDRMPNGNTLVIAWEFRSYDDAVKKGRAPGTLPKPGDKNVQDYKPAYDGIWVDCVLEFDPSGKEVWSWNSWDHIGTGADQFDINYRLPIKNFYGDSDWMHLNSVRYNAKTNEVLISSRNFSEVFIVKHDKSGKVVWRYGNPSTHGEGAGPSFLDDGSQLLFGNHDANWLPDGKISIFDNGWNRTQANRSRVVIVDRKTQKIDWEYAANNNNAFYSAYQGGAQVLPNGNVFITSSATGHLFEVNKNKDVVWEYVSPWVMKGEVVPMVGEKQAWIDPTGVEDINIMANMVHRAFRYGPDFPGLKGRDLSKKTVIFPDAPKWYKLYDKAFLYKSPLNGK